MNNNVTASYSGHNLTLSVLDSVYNRGPFSWLNNLSDCFKSDCMHEYLTFNYRNVAENVMAAIF